MSRWETTRIKVGSAFIAALGAMLLLAMIGAGCGSGGTETKTPPKSGGVMSEPIDYPGGVNPALAATADGWVVEAHEARTNDSIWYNVGRFSDDGSFKWQGEPQRRTAGVEPGVAMTDDGYVVLVHRARNGNGLWYETGRLDKGTGKISWLHDGEYDSGSYPSVIVFNDGTLLENHLSTVGSNQWYKVGSINKDNNSVDLGGASSLEGTRTLAAFKDSDRLVQLFGDGYRFGRVDKESKTIAWLAAKENTPGVSNLYEYNPTTHQQTFYQITTWLGASAYTFQPAGAPPQLAYVALAKSQNLRWALYIGQARVEGLSGTPVLTNFNFVRIGTGEQPAFACAGAKAVEMHKAAGSTGTGLWYSTGILQPR